MNCPKCEASLSIKEGEGHIGFTCSSCEGIWLSNIYIESLKHNYDFEPDKFIKALSNNPVSTKHPCPGCSINLFQSTFNNIDLVWCSSCSGVWFDKNELNTLVTIYKNDIKPGEKIFDGLSIIALFLSS